MKPRVLILEDNFLLSENLAEIVHHDLEADALQVSHVSEAMTKIPDGFALALLDIEVLDGKSYPVARKLMQNDIPFIFVSGNDPDSLPKDLRDTPFLSKPASGRRLVQLSKSLSSAFN